MTAGASRRRLIARGDLPGSNGGIYNPGALLTERSILLLCRREVDYRFRRPLAFPELIELDRTTLEVVRHRTLARVGYPYDTRIEDFRCIEHDGKRLVAHTWVRPERIKPAISRMHDDALERFDEFDLPIRQTPVEKNWVLFVHDGVLHCLYKLDPLTIFAHDPDGSWRLVKQEDNGWAAPLAGTLSNSANLIPFEDGYLGFWHTIANDRYIQGALLLGRDLALRSRTGVLLDGSDVQDGYKPGVLYVSSLIERDGEVLAFYGEADAHTGVAVFDRRELAEELGRTRFQPADSIRLRFEGASISDAFRAIQTVHEFSERRGLPRIRLFVADPRLRETLEQLAKSNVIVQPDDELGAAGCQGVVSGATGTVTWSTSAD